MFPGAGALPGGLQALAAARASPRHAARGAGGTAGLAARAERIGFVEGAEWAEDAVGTNAPGTAVALGRPLQIYAGEHFIRPVHPWSCSAAPVRDPDTGAVIGVIDLTGGDHIAAPHALALVRATVAAAEAELRLLRLRGVLPATPRRGRRPRGRGWRYWHATGHC
ncbi:GAF domain-containing protein [Actinacidiphila sp. bgisy167]|uniref:GAF domain-containing protein n=1 Tax=Actinacidiphila sp. bgisy167 TaxID=3413797 RepID=UPI003D758DE8